VIATYDDIGMALIAPQGNVVTVEATTCFHHILSCCEQNCTVESSVEVLNTKYRTRNSNHLRAPAGLGLLLSGMKIFSKLVATLLFVALGAAPLLGVIPCQGKAKSSRCCAVGCPVAAMEMSSTQSLVESCSSTQCGCQASPVGPITIAPAQQESSDVALVDNALASFASIAMFRAKGSYIPPDLESCRHSRSVLCIFQV